MSRQSSNADPATMAAFGASHEACYKWPEDTAEHKACRAAFCAGAAWAVTEIDRLKTALIEARKALNGPHDGPMSILAAADAFNIIEKALESATQRDNGQQPRGDK